MIIFKIARKFELKLAVAQSLAFDITRFRKLMKSEIEKILQAFNNAVAREFLVAFPAYASDLSQDVKEFLEQDDEDEEGEGAKDAKQFFASKKQPPPLEPAAIQAVKDLMTIKSAAFYLYNKIDEMPINEIPAPAMDIVTLIDKQAGVSGLDTFGINQPNYLDVIKAFTSMYTTRGRYGDLSEVNPMAKRSLRIKINQFTNNLKSVGIAAKNIKSLLNKAATEKFFTEVLESKILAAPTVKSDIERSKKDLENHEVEHFLWDITKLADKENALLYWYEFIKPFPDMVELVRRTWHTPIFKKLWRHKYNESDKVSILSDPIIAERINILRRHIAEQKRISDEKEALKYSRHFGDPEPISRIKPNAPTWKNPLSEETLLSKVIKDPEQQVSFEDLDDDIKEKVLSGEISIESALGESVSEKPESSLYAVRFPDNPKSEQAVKQFILNKYKNDAEDRRYLIGQWNSLDQSKKQDVYDGRISVEEAIG